MKTTPNQPNRPNRPNQPNPNYQPNQPNPNYRPNQPNPNYRANQLSQYEQVGQLDTPQATSVAKWVLLPLRLFLGLTFVYAGIQKLTDPQYFNPKAPGYIGKQIIGFSTNSPLHFLLIHTIEHAVFFGAVVAVGELAIGLGTLFGVLLRPAAFFGILINIVFFLSATWHVYPYFYGSDIVFVFCWLTLFLSGPVNTGMPSFDEWFVQNKLSENLRREFAPLISLVLGINAEPTAVSALENSGRQGAGGGRRVQNRYAQVQRAKQQSRRNFLWGMVTGGAGIAVLAWLGSSMHFFGGAGPAGSGSSTSSGSTATSAGTATTSGPTVIAKTSAVPTNSAATFTLASNGDPGVLVHLNNGQFVAFDATCTHAGCPVSYDPTSQLLQCPCHGAAFDPSKNAAVVQGPAPTPLTSVTIQVNKSTGEITTNQ
jgi:thiosulfate dehydrogenase [quinone] large subunit